MTQLALLERQMAAALPADAVQRANWPALVASHQKAIAYYRARLAEPEDNPG